MTNGFFDRLTTHRETESKIKWEGTFKDYFDLLLTHPNLNDHAHARIHNMIMSHGIKSGIGGQRIYNFFDQEIFGINTALEHLVEDYFNAAAQRLDVKKRILLLMGPVAGGKSTLATMLKRGLEAYTKTDAGAVYGVKGCPMHESPLNLVPHELRAQLRSEHGLIIDGDPCPRCQMMLKDKYGGRIEEVVVERIAFSEKERVGIGTFQPSDPKSQDISELVGSIDFSTIGEFGSESDPRAYRFDGELNIANRGMMEFQEMLKCDEKFLWNLLFLSQEQQFKAGRFALISADEVIVAHTNETEFRRFSSDKKNEALQSRIIVLKVPYNLRVDDEVRIYEKLIGDSALSRVHLAPHALKTASIFSVLTRLMKSERGIGLMNKLKLYNGEAMSEVKPAEVREIMREGYDNDEGMHGIDPRYVINRLASALVKEASASPVQVSDGTHVHGTGSGCINALDVLRALKDGLDTHSSITKEERTEYINFLGLARAEYDEIAKDEVRKAFVYSFDDQAKNILANYLENIEAYCSHGTLRDPVTDEEMEADERLMRSIEEQIAVSENAKKAFREEIMIRVGTYARRGQSFSYDSHDRLREAIQKKLFADVKDVVKITTSSRNPDPEQLRRVNQVVTELMDKHGYCATCANETIKYVGSLLNR